MFFKSKKDAKKVMKVIDSCDTFGQLNTAMNMVHNYGKRYDYNYYWRKLDKYTFTMWMNHLDNIEYQERLEEVNGQSMAADTEGSSDGVESNA